MAKYTLLLQRDSEHKGVVHPKKPKIEDSTLGTVTLTNNETGDVLFKGCCCENIGPSTDVPQQDKRIVARTYTLKWTDSSKNGSLSKTHPQYLIINPETKKPTGRNKAIWIINPEDKKFANRRILIHVGNYPQDTEGCLLIGKQKNTKSGTVINSIAAIHELFQVVEKVGIENIELVIKEIA